MDAGTSEPRMIQLPPIILGAQARRRSLDLPEADPAERRQVIRQFIERGMPRHGGMPDYIELDTDPQGKGRQAARRNRPGSPDLT